MDPLHLHIVSFDVPDPADYGGVIDVRYKMEALHAAGVQVHLHCFEYGRGQRPALEAFCKKVHYYKRTSSKALLLHRLPFIAVSRRSPLLLQHLSADAHPILFEGLHSCYYLDHPALADRTKLVRTHNVEHEYYGALAEAEPSAWKRTYLREEARKLRRFESVLRHADGILAISPEDAAHFSGLYGNTVYIPAFHHAGTGAFAAQREKIALYHGNLSVPENDRAALFLVSEVAHFLSHPLVIAGSRPSAELRKAVADRPGVTLLDNLSPDALEARVSTAAVNVIPTFQATGIKLKLLYALYCGAHCVVNEAMVQGNGLGDLCVVANSAEEIGQAINACMEKPFTREAYDRRVQRLELVFSNKTNAQRIADIISGKRSGA